MNSVVISYWDLQWPTSLSAFRPSTLKQSDPHKATSAKIYIDGVEFIPTSRNIPFGYQFKSIAKAGLILGPIIALMWGWVPALVWILLGTLFIAWVQDQARAMVAMR